MADRRLLLAERCGPEFRLLGVHPLRTGDEVTIGREGTLALATDPPDPRVSRLAVTVRCAAEGWSVDAVNRNGTLVHRRPGRDRRRRPW